MPYRDPKENEVDSPLFKAIWETIKTWDVNVPEEYEGYCGPSGNHVMAIVDAILESEEIKQKITVAIGMASMCWEDTKKAGQYNVDRGMLVVEELLKMISKKREKKGGGEE